MASATYDVTLDMARTLSMEERAQLIEEVQKSAPPAKRTRSIMELEGLGAELWREIDVDEYLRQERASWEKQY